MKFLAAMSVTLIAALWAQRGEALELDDGMWWDRDRPGTGVFLETQGDLTMVGYFGFAPEGGARWYIGAGLVEADGSVTAQLAAFEGGACPSCSYSGPTQLPATLSVRIVPSGYRVAEVRIDAGPAFEIERFNFGFDEYGYSVIPPNVLTKFPDLRGEWMFVPVNSANEAQPIRVALTSVEDIVPDPRLSFDHAEVVFRGEGAELRCFGYSFDLTSATPSCVLSVNGETKVSMYGLDISFDRIQAYEGEMTELIPVNEGVRRTDNRWLGFRIK